MGRVAISAFQPLSSEFGWLFATRLIYTTHHGNKNEAFPLSMIARYLKPLLLWSAISMGAILFVYQETWKELVRLDASIQGHTRVDDVALYMAERMSNQNYAVFNSMKLSVLRNGGRADDTAVLARASKLKLLGDSLRYIHTKRPDLLKEMGSRYLSQLKELSYDPQDADILEWNDVDSLSPARQFIEMIACEERVYRSCVRKVGLTNICVRRDLKLFSLHEKVHVNTPAMLGLSGRLYAKEKYDIEIRVSKGGAALEKHLVKYDDRAHFSWLPEASGVYQIEAFATLEGGRELRYALSNTCTIEVLP